MRSTFNQLSARKVSTLKHPGRYTDGLGLHLYIDPAGNKRWVLRLTVKGRRRDIGLGSAVEVSLAEARQQRDRIRRQLRDGLDPIAEKHRQRFMPTFEAYARQLHIAIAPDWKNPKHAQQWINTLATYAFPLIGDLPIDQVDAAAVKKVLTPIWTEKPETARRVKQRVGRVISAAIGDQLHKGPNPTPDSTMALSGKRPKVRNFAAMPYADVPAFMARLAASDMSPSGKLAFQFLILTATRTNEVLNAQWAEIDLNKRVWTIPAERMKMGEAHTVPLSMPARLLLKAARDHDQGDGLVFPSATPSKSLSNMVFLQAMKRFEQPFTAHGFRSAFRDWAEEQTSYSHAVKEAALAHKTRNKVEAAYRRTTLIEQRKALMADWGAFCDPLTKIT